METNIKSKSTTYNILFLVFHGFADYNGISKKIFSQIKALDENGSKVHLCYTDFDERGNQLRKIDDKILDNFGCNFFSKITKNINYSSLTKYIIENKIDLLYVRYAINANPFIVLMFKKLKKNGVKIALEIPTYPYDGEFSKARFSDKIFYMIDKLYRKRLTKFIDKIVTFTDEKEIFGCPTINISNAIDFNSIPLKINLKKLKENDTLNLISVSEIHYWHGIDRVIEGMNIYYENIEKGEPYIDVLFHIVGRGFGQEYDDLVKLVHKYKLDNYVIFYGNKSGNELDDIFASADMGIASLGRHRSGITKIKTLKNREYAARGIPFIYSEIDTDFENMPYIMKADPNDSPIDIIKIIDFYKSLNIDSQSIRNSIINKLSWTIQMKKVLDNIDK